MKQMKDSISRKELSEDDQARIAAEILKERQDKNFNNVYSTGYCFAEFFCYLNIVCQWIITTRFLGEIKENWITTGFDELNFYTLGFHVLKKIQTNPWLPLKLMFPRQSYCRFQMYGSGGRMNTYQFLCLLSLNIIHDKVSHTNSRINNNNYKQQLILRFSWRCGSCSHLSLFSRPSIWSGGSSWSRVKL